MSATPRFGLPFLSAGQAQKEVFHNEALQALDMLTCCVVEELPRADPPSSPEVGSCYLLADSPTGPWAGKGGYLAGFTAGGWRFVAPTDGMTALVRSTATWAAHRAGAWEFGQVRGDALILNGEQVVGVRGSAIAAPSGGTTVDTQARSTVGQILAALRAHGLIQT